MIIILFYIFLFNNNNNNNLIMNKLFIKNFKYSFKPNSINYYYENEIEEKRKEFIKSKKLITIKPCGFYGFYIMGVISFIKENYNLDNYIFSGASAGSWNSLLLTYKKNTTELSHNIINNLILHKKVNNVNKLENIIKNHILSNYKMDDFNLDKLFIGITSLNNFKIKTLVLSDFNNLEDAIDCCITSSHIPLLTGGLLNYYRNNYYFDGGFSKYPYLNIVNSSLHITPIIWNNNLNYNNMFFTTMVHKNKFNIKQLYDDGYKDSQLNKKKLDEIFI